MTDISISPIMSVKEGSSQLLVFLFCLLSDLCSGPLLVYVVGKLILPIIEAYII